ncbi:MAG: type II toxin-antitoxin system PemK/MazF family toxin [Actinocatenispora sp.]
MNRGEVWAYKSLTRTRSVVVVSTDSLNELGEPLVVDVTPSGPTGPTALLSVELPDGLGFARCRRIDTASPDRFAERVAVLPPDVMEQVDVALRAVLDL